MHHFEFPATMCERTCFSRALPTLLFSGIFGQVINERWYFGLVLNLYYFYYDKFIECFNFNDYGFLFLKVVGFWGFFSKSSWLSLSLVFIHGFKSSIYFNRCCMHSYFKIRYLVTTTSHHSVLNLCRFGEPQSQPPVSLSL